jgi:hypothetical protein
MNGSLVVLGRGRADAARIGYQHAAEGDGTEGCSDPGELHVILLRTWSLQRTPLPAVAP